MIKKSRRKISALEEAIEFARQEQWESAYESLLKFDREYDNDLLSEFRSRECKVEPKEIAHLDILGCATLVTAIARQIYWDEPPIMSINNKLVNFGPQEFEFKAQIRALIERLETLHL